MFGQRMYPGFFTAIFLLDDCIGNGELALNAELEQEMPIVITVTNAVPPKDLFSGHSVPPNSSIKVTKNQDLIIYKRIVKCLFFTMGSAS